VLPSQAGEHQLIRLPGQTRVSPEEYKEFLGLGHGDVFDLDPDRYFCAYTPRSVHKQTLCLDCEQYISICASSSSASCPAHVWATAPGQQ